MSRPETHPWRLGKGGRVVRSEQEGHGHQVATLTCACGQTEDVRFRNLCDSEEMDRKFRQKGWRLDPSKCPECIHKRKKGKPMAVAAAPTPAAIKAQARMFTLLSEHFDPDAGAYGAGGGYTDAKIGEEVGLPPELIAAFRTEAFGPLKEPPEVAALARDIEALTQLLDETIAPIKAELSQLRQRLAELRRKFPA